MRSNQLILSLALAGLMAGCASFPVAPPVTKDTATSVSAVSGIHASLEGIALAPASLVANNSAGLIGNNSAGLIGNNSAGYRTAAVDTEVPLPRAVVYLTDASERFYEGADGKPLTAATDASGRYRIPSGIPVDRPVIVNVVLSENRREVGFTVPKAGVNTVNVSLATTYVTEFLRHRARYAQRDMASYPLASLSDLTERTNRAIASGALGVPSLKIADLTAMTMTYASAIGRNVEGLGDAWAKVLGHRVIAIQTIAGTGEGSTRGDGGPAAKASVNLPKGLASDKAGNLYVVEEGGNRIRRIAPDGTITTVAGTGNKGFGGDGGPARQATLNWPRSIAIDAAGNLIIADTLNMAIRVVAARTGTFFGVPMTEGNIYTIAGTPDPAVIGAGNYPNDYYGDGIPATQAKLAGPRGLAVDSTGNIYFSDSWGWETGPVSGRKLNSWHFIRRISTSGIIETIVGVESTSEVPSFGFSPDGTPAKQAHIDYPNQLAIDAQDRLYFAEASAGRIRMIDLKTPSMPLATAAGGGDIAGDGPATAIKLQEPYGVTIGKDGNVYFAERANGGRIRVILSGNTRTLAGGGVLNMDGDGPQATLTQPHDICALPSGDLIIAESRAHKLRKLTTGFGL